MLLASGCATVGPGGTLPPEADTTAARQPGGVQWTVGTRPQIDLWYHGLAYTGFGATGEIPIYQPSYVDSMVAAKRDVGAYPTVLDRRSEEFARTFAGDPRFSALQFLPLYFPSGEAFFAALRTWIQVQGDPRRVNDPAQAQAVAFLSQQLPTVAQRRTVASWLEVLAEEDRVFYEPYRRRQQTRLSGVPAAVQARWDQFQPRLRPFLDYHFLNEGELILSLPVGSEGRTLDLGRRGNRVTVGMPDPAQPERAVWAFLHELMYPFVGPVLEDQLSPAQRREMDEQLLSRRAAVRAGALLLERVAPAEIASYRAAYLDWAGVPVPAAAAAQEVAFESAYPLPGRLAQALADGIDNAMRGI